MRLGPPADAAKRRTHPTERRRDEGPSESKKGRPEAAFKGKKCALADSGSERLCPRAAVAGEAETQEAEHHHRPSRRLRDRRGKSKDFVEKFVADDLMHICGRMDVVIIEIRIRRRTLRPLGKGEARAGRVG